MPITYYTFLIFSLALSGIPFFSGFLSKDAILGGTLAFAMAQSNPIHYLLPTFGFLAAIITAFYMFRLIIKTFFGEPKRPDLYEHIHESPKVMTGPLITLATLSIWIFFTLPSISPFGSENSWYYHLVKKPESAVSVQLGHPVLEIPEHIEHSAHVNGMMISIIFALTGILLAYMFYYWKKWDVEAFTNKIRPLYDLSYHKYYIDEIYNATLVRGLLLWNNILAWFDAHIIDGLVNGAAFVTRHISRLSGIFDLGFVDGLVNAVADLTRDTGQLLRKVQTGQLQFYIFGALAGLVLIIIGTLM